MKLQLLGQGFEPKSKHSVGNHLIAFFNDTDYHTFWGMSAFASKAGVSGLSRQITKATTHFKSITLIVGIDQNGTSKEALEALIDLKINTYIFYQPSATIFHPKIYLFEGDTKSALIVGSSNLTAHGLFSNIETSLLIYLENNIEEDNEIIDQLKEYFAGIYNLSDPNLKKLNKKLLDDLVLANLVPTEVERKALQDKPENIDNRKHELLISSIFPKRAIPRIPAEFLKNSVQENSLVKKSKSRSRKISWQSSELLWESGPLTERDLNIPKGANTNPTGSMFFKKGKTGEIDQRHYFRDKIFSSLHWVGDKKPNSKHYERAKALFSIIVDGKDFGVFSLVVNHNTKTDTRAYQQKNSMTSLSLGEAKSIIGKEELIGKNAKLFRSIGGKSDFTIIIE